VATFDLSSNANELWPMVGMPGRPGGVRDNSGRVPGVLLKIINYFRRMCREEFSEPATQMIFDLMNNSQEDKWLQFACAKELLDRAWGSPKNISLSSLSRMLLWCTKLKKRRANV
jgi:hypothetical protein